VETPDQQQEQTEPAKKNERIRRRKPTVAAAIGRYHRLRLLDVDSGRVVEGKAEEDDDGGNEGAECDGNPDVQPGRLSQSVAKREAHISTMTKVTKRCGHHRTEGSIRRTLGELCCLFERI
jgi:hypothetical protein